MVITFQRVIHPFSVTCFLMGLSYYPIKQPKSKIAYLGILYYLTMWFAYAYFIYWIVTFVTLKALYRTSLSTVIVQINNLTSFTSAIMSLYYQKRFGTCIKKLAAVDDTLEELGTPKMYQKMYTWSKRVVIGWLMYSLAIIFYDITWWLNKKETVSRALLLSFLINHSLHINTFMDILFVSLLWYIGSRFDKINEHIRCLIVKKKCGLRCTQKKPVIALRRYNLRTDNYKRTLWSSMHLHLELCRIGREMNLIFGTQMTFEITSYFFYLTTMFYYLYKMLTEEHREEISVYKWFNISLWVSSFLIRLFAVNYICETVEIKHKEIHKIIPQLTNTFRYTDVWKEINQFTLRAIHHPLKFTGMGLFYLGNDLLRKFFTMIVTYVIIMVQLNVKYPSKS